MRATTALFSVIYAGLINPYPFTAADRIVRLTMQSKAGQADWINLNGAQVRQVRQLAIVESLLAMDYHAMILTGHDIPENVDAIGLIANGFADLGVPPALGRGLWPSDAVEGQDPMAGEGVQQGRDLPGVAAVHHHGLATRRVGCLRQEEELGVFPPALHDLRTPEAEVSGAGCFDRARRSRHELNRAPVALFARFSPSHQPMFLKEHRPRVLIPV